MSQVFPVVCDLGLYQDRLSIVVFEIVLSVVDDHDFVAGRHLPQPMDVGANRLSKADDVFASGWKFPNSLEAATA